MKTKNKAQPADMNPDHDPVVKLAREFVRYQRQGDEMQRKEAAADDWMCNHYDTAEQHCYDSYEAIRKMITVTKASSLEGAMAHVLFFYSEASDAINDIEDGHKRETALRPLRRLLFSIIDVMREHTSITPAELGMGFLTSEQFNPWVDVEKRIAAIAQDKQAAAQAA